MPESLVPPPMTSATVPHAGGRLTHGCHIERHAHTEGQLVYPVTGALATITERGTRLAPANRITWTPPGFEHSHRVYGETDVRIVNLPLELCAQLPAHPAVFAVSPVLREGLLALTDRPETRPGAHARLRAVVLDELVDEADESLHLPEPRDDRLRAVTELLRAEPARADTLPELGRTAGASGRTLSRLFHDELGMSFQQWRTVLRLHHAVILLGEGRSVTGTAHACGWSNPTSFIDAFTALVGRTPGRYQAELSETR